MMRSMPHQVTASLAFAFGALFAQVAQAQAPTISYTQPSAVQPGATVDVVLVGDNLVGASSLWTSFPCKATLAPGIEKNGQLKDRVTFRLEVPADQTVSVQGIRVATDKGTSSLKLLLVDDLPTAADSGNNKSIATAQPVTLPIAIDGVSEPESYDYYKIAGKAGQRFSAEVVAARLGSTLDPVIRLLDATGKRELIYSDDEGGIAPDCRLTYKFPADGDYLLEIRDIRYQGSGAHRYRLRLGDFPILTSPYPTGAQLGSQAKLAFAGVSAAEVPAIDFKAPAEPLLERTWIGAKYAGGQGSVFLPLMLSTSPELVEAEPNDKPEQSTVVMLPTAISGKFETAKDRDYFQFEGKKGQRYLFRGVTRSLGSPSDLFLRLFKADGGQVAEAEDSGTAEGALNFTFPEDGIYRLAVEDLHRRGGPQHVYRIEAAPYQPGFSLQLTDGEKKDQFLETVSAPRGGVFRVRVVCARRDFNDPIELLVQGAGEGVQLSGNKIDTGKNETVMLVTLPAALEQNQARVIQIVGKAKIGDKEVLVTASTGDALRKLFANNPYPPPQLTSLLGLGIGPVFPDFFALKVPAPAVLPQLVGVGSVKVVADRKDKFAEAISLAVEGLPENIKAEVKPIEKGKNDVEIKLTGPTDLPEGEHKFRITGNGTHQLQPRSFVLGEVVLRVIKPLAVSIAPAGPLATGAKQKVKVSITRYGENKEPVTLILKNLPTGVTAPENLAIPGDKNELEFELTSVAEAAVGKIENLQVAATGKVKDQMITVESPPVALEVKKP